MKKQYILYGTGWYAEKFLFDFKEKEKIVCCVDGYKTGKFHGIPIYNLESVSDIQKYIIIVTAVWENYERIKDVLKQKGLKEFYNFYWAEIWGKKIAAINANCYGEFYKRYLRQSKTFTNEYVFWELPQIQLNQQHCIPDELLKVCDLFIHQDIKPDNKYGYKLSDEYALSKLKKECRNITVPNMVGMGKWNFPTMTQRVFREGKPAMFWRDSVLDEACEKCENIQEIIKYLNSEILFSGQKVRELFDNFINKLKVRENNWDIIISDYIIKNYKREKLFYDVDHPTDAVMQEIGKRLCAILNLNDIVGELDYPLNWDEAFTPSYVKKALGLAYEEKYVRERGNWGKRLSEKKMSLEEYVKEYAWWFYDKEILG